MTHRITIEGEPRVIDAAPGETVLAAAERMGIRIPHSCTLGNCGTCRVQLLEGSVSYDSQPLALSSEEASRGLALACQAQPASDVVIAIDRAPVAEPSRQQAMITDIQPLTADVTHLSIVLPGLDPFVFLPGQYMDVLLEDGSRRSFSMASRPEGNAADFHIRRIRGGRFTRDLPERLQPGDMLDVELPLGTFRFHPEDYRALAFVATGTGLAPIKAMLEALLDDPDCPPVSLYWGMRTEADLYLAETIRSWEGRLYDFRFVPVLSRAGASWAGRRGHVQHAVVEDLPDLSEHSVYLCGSPSMIADAKSNFLGHGASTDHLYTEGFSLASSA